MIHTVTIDVTTHCNRRCENCCAGIGINRALEHHDWAYFERAAKFLYGIDRVNMTGGEPTAHPYFDQLASKFRKMFGCNKLTLSTNGYQAKRYWMIIAEAFDWVDFSDYGDNGHALKWLKETGLHVNVYPAGTNGVHFISRARRGTGKACFRACSESGTVAYANGQVYGCCVAPGITGAQGLQYSNDITQISHVVADQLPLPCGECFFAN